MSRASNEALDALHGLLAEAQADELRRNLARARLPRRIADPANPSGKAMIANPDYSPLDTKLVATAIKFLKDNGIDAPEAAQRFSGIVDELKRLSVDDPIHYAN